MAVFFKYRKASAYEVGKKLGERIELTDYQKSRITEVINDLPYTIYQFEPAQKANFFIRLSAPVYFLAYVSLLLFMPIKWFATGNRYYNQDHFFLVFMRNWYKRLGF